MISRERAQDENINTDLYRFFITVCQAWQNDRPAPAKGLHIWDIRRKDHAE